MAATGTGDIDAAFVVIEGRVTGDILARERLEPIARSASVRLELVQSNFRKIAAVIPPLKREGRGGESLPTDLPPLTPPFFLDI